MVDRPAVSVIIPCYNSAQYAPEAIDSVLNQTYKNIEIIVVDDGSKDNLKEVVDPYMKSGAITYLFQANKGVSAARNAGLKLARGEYVKFLDSDDFLYPLQIEKQVQDLQTNGGGFCVSKYQVLLPSGKLIKKDVDIGPPKLQYAEFIEACRGGGPHSFLFRKSVVDEVKGFDEDLSDCADLDIYIRILRNGHYVTVVDYHGCCYRVLDNSMSSQTQRLFIDKCRVYEKVNAAFLEELQLPHAQLIDKLLIINPRLIYECRARDLDLNKHLPQTLCMTTRLYKAQKTGWNKLLFNGLGITVYSRLQYWLKNVADKDYKERLLKEEVSWKFDEQK